MKSNNPFKLYSGLGISIFLVLLVGYFSIDTLNKQVEKTTHLIKIKKSISDVQDLQYNIVQMRSARFNYWIDGNEGDITNYELTASAIKPILVKLHLELTQDISLNNKVNSLDTALTALNLYWGNNGKILSGQSRNTLQEIADTEEAAVQKVLLLTDELKRSLIFELDATENSIKESFSVSTKIIVGGVILLIAIVLILVNAVVATLKSRFRSERRLKETVAKMEDINQVATEKINCWKGLAISMIIFKNPIHFLLYQPM
ncbi:CHASE3 domain-containing protein [Sediminibacterium salmoneum]|uniref:CHASE3 domain-containing protein n=1 Tax=Sediminibacterium salmoneum TaxID=426421 RepID=UPI00047C80AB|nr:hypothetical protein [Sediminibacterium salmoneum]